MPSSSSDLVTHLRSSTSKLQEITAAVEAGETSIAPHLESLQEFDSKIRAATRLWTGTPTTDEVSAYRAWNEAAGKLRDAVDQSFQELDGNLGDLRRARTALRAYSTLNPHTTSQHIHKKL